MNRHKIHHPVGFFDQYSDFPKIEKSVSSFVVSFSDEPNIKEFGVSVYLMDNRTNVEPTVGEIGVAVYLFKDSL